MPQSKGHTANEESWTDHLEPDETLVWAGRPIRAFRWHTHGLFASAMLVIQVAFGLLALSLLSLAIVPILDLHPLGIVMVFFCPGLLLLCTMALWNWLKRRSAHYALTNNRALVVRRFPLKRLISYPIYRDKPILVGKTEPKSLYFVHENRQINFTKLRLCYGFEHLEDFDAALKHATSAQDDAPLRPRNPIYKAYTWTSASPSTNTG